MEAKQPRVRVLGLGLEPRFRNMINVFFARSYNDYYQLSDKTGEVVVVDMDAVGAREAFARYRQSNAHRPSILFSVDEQEYETRDNILLLRKPFTVRQLQSAFEIVNLRFLKRSQSAPGAATTRQQASAGASKTGANKPRRQGSAGLIEPDDHRAAFEKDQGARQTGAFRAAFSLARHDEYVKLNSLLPGIASAGKETEEQFYQPDHYLQGKLKRAYEQARSAGLNARIKMGGGTITIDSKRCLAKVQVGKFQFREVASFPLNSNNFSITLLPGNKASVVGDEPSRVQQFDELLWRAALYAARGRVPEGVDIEATAQLRQWPNLTRLMLVPGVVRISALWVAHPESISGLANKLGLSVRDVASFYSAADALGLFSSGVVPESSASPAPQAGASANGLLRRILLRLRG